MTPVFAAMHTCGGWIAVAVDDPTHARENAKCVSSWMHAGYRIDKVSVDDIRTGKIKMCECKKTKQKNLLPLR